MVLYALIKYRALLGILALVSRGQARVLHGILKGMKDKARGDRYKADIKMIRNTTAQAYWRIRAIIREGKRASSVSLPHRITPKAGQYSTQ